MHYDQHPWTPDRVAAFRAAWCDPELKLREMFAAARCSSISAVSMAAKRLGFPSRRSVRSGNLVDRARVARSKYRGAAQQLGDPHLAYYDGEVVWDGARQAAMLAHLRAGVSFAAIARELNVREQQLLPRAHRALNNDLALLAARESVLAARTQVRQSYRSKAAREIAMVDVEEAPDNPVVPYCVELGDPLLAALRAAHGSRVPA